ncbi:MAG TPA: SH3 domain-containing protein [Oculatellaceae cyanobacterium]
MRKLAHTSIALTLLAGCTTHASLPQPQTTTATPQVIQPTLKTVKQASSTASRALPEPSQQPQFKNVASLEPTNWSNELCTDGRYFPVKGASLAVWNSCQYINSNSLKAESIVLATAKDSENVADSMADKGFKKVGWKDFNPLTDKPASVCIVYGDKSVACHKGDGSNEARKSTGETVSSTSSEPSPRNDRQAADTEAVLIASDSDSRINLRATPEVSGEYLGYGLIGDRVEILEQATSHGYTWHKVRFPRSGAVGWIRSDFVSVVGASKTNQPSSKPPIYSSSSEVTSNAPTYYTPAVATSGGSCNSPDDLDARGHRCGGRASSGRRRR